MIEVEVEADAWTTALPDASEVARRAAEAALAVGAEGEVVVLLSDDDAVAALNQRYRGRSGPTNVLSFPAVETARPLLGDLVLAFGVCLAEAEAQGKPLGHHLAHLVVHGTLHLMGRDHQDELEAEAMEAEERTILASLGVPDPYRYDHDR